jgi:hypothetical protein
MAAPDTSAEKARWNWPAMYAPEESPETIVRCRSIRSANRPSPATAGAVNAAATARAGRMGTIRIVICSFYCDAA